MSVGRKPELRWYESRNQFCATIKGKLHFFGKDAEKAKDRFAFHLASANPTESPKEANPLLGDLIADWIIFISSRSHNADRLRLCKARLANFQNFVGLSMRVGDLLPAHVENWIKSKTGRDTAAVSKGTERNYKAMVLAVLNHAAEPESAGGAGTIPTNPLKGKIRLPEGEARGEEAVWTKESFEQVLLYAHPPFADVVKFLAWTGIRPSLITRLEAKHYNRRFRRFDTDKITVHPKKLKYIRLNDDAIALVERLIAEHPAGKLFRNTRGDAWSEHGLSLHLWQMLNVYETTKDLEWQPKLTLKGLRHSFATAFLRQHPNEIEYLRVILGHSDYKMIFKHYGKLVAEHEAIGNRLAGFKTF